MTSPIPSEYASFLLAVLLVCVAPGPDMLYISATSAGSGTRNGILSACGMATGMAVWAMLIALGMGSVCANMPVSVAIRLVGGCYLAYLGVREFTGTRHLDDSNSKPNAPVNGHAFRRAVVINLTNPKVALFFIAFLPQFVDPGTSDASCQLLVLGVSFLAVGLVVDCTIAIASGRILVVLGKGNRGGRLLRFAPAIVYLVLTTLSFISALAMVVP